VRVVGRRRDKELIRCVDVGRGSRRSVWALAGCGPSLAVLLSREVEGGLRSRVQGNSIPMIVLKVDNFTKLSTYRRGWSSERRRRPRSYCPRGFTLFLGRTAASVTCK